MLGAIPRLKNDLFPERHMGLTPFQEHIGVQKSISAIAELGSKCLDMDSIWEIAVHSAKRTAQSAQREEDAESIAHSAKREEQRTESIAQSAKSIAQKAKNTEFKIRNSQPATRNPQPKIGVIRDSAFQFYYPENFEELEKRGAKLIEISALRENDLPDLDALYIGGGFPETHAIALAENTDFKRSLYKAIEKGLPVYAECGGLMYLGESLILDNKIYPMVGVFPLVFGLQKKPRAHGYTIIKVEKTNPYFPKGCILKGHEFHYSHVIEVKRDKVYMAFKNKRGQGIKDNMDGICYKNVLAAYTHLHALGAGEWVDGLMRCAIKFKNQCLNSRSQAPNNK